ncbi:SapC family protein [Pontixanthobacter aestiaquae]|uniref:Multidrug transporter n=1 Tax=Pontixanthobacter aestiaquae TaxID=1509367 RepID=A0A844Z993_9SPHN|nr:SapC family protein [Pontixanthobacter aestiaquae]MDN3645118.1 SapC family protein [Pontixanthobacter aestiaquae]MXO83882.1 multidrug transporter [Pontixanthobacter aestiaquae]
MASAPQPQLPLFYKDLMPLNSRDHAKWKTKSSDSADWLIGQHAIPLTVDEFVQTARDFPIIFSSGDNPLPLALMGLNEGVNTFVDDKGKINDPVYLPAYVRRYPFMLAKLTPEGDDLSLCFDPTAGTVGEFDEGQDLFDKDGKATEATQNILQFCEHFEGAGQRTKAFIDELKKHELLMDGEIAISQNDDPDKPFVYRGFQMIDQEKLKEVRGDVLRDWNKNGMLALIYSHMMSLDLMRVIFARQVQQGTAPKAADAPAS